MSKLLTSREDKLRVLDLLKELLKALAFHAMSEKEIEVLAKALYDLRENGKAMEAQLKVYGGRDNAMRIEIDLTNGPTVQ